MSSWLIELERKLYLKNSFNDFLEQIEEKIAVPRLYIFLGLISFLLVSLVLGNIGLFLCNVVGFVYPTYASVKAIETREDGDDDKRWLTYWVVYGLFIVAEFFAGFLLGFVPFYALLKCALFVWLMLPGPNNGSLVVYRKWIRPLFLRVDEAGAAAILPPGVTREAAGVMREAAGVMREAAD